MNLPLHERAVEGTSPDLVRLTGLSLGEGGIVFPPPPEVVSTLLPARKPGPGEQYRFHFDMTKCIGCRSCEVACNEQNNNPADILWRRIGELEAGSYPETQRHYLSMGCNHCLDADCLKGCPVDAYTKDPVTGIVLHSADACIGCSYCVWNCPYSVPQYNPERGVVGKCDMCKGRLDEGLEPACVNACPEGAIAIELVNMAEWREDYALADSPGMPAAEQTVSTTRITLPGKFAAAKPDPRDPVSRGLERVDLGQIEREHAHVPLIYMTALMQAVSGALWVLLAWHALDALSLFVLLAYHGHRAHAFDAASGAARVCVSRAQDVAALLAEPRGSLVHAVLRGARRCCRYYCCPAIRTSCHALASLRVRSRRCHLRRPRYACQRGHLPGPGTSGMEHAAHAHGLHPDRGTAR